MNVESIRQTLLGLNVGDVSLRYYVLYGLSIVAWLFLEILNERQQNPSQKQVGES